MSTIVHLEKTEDFNKSIKSGVTLVDFYADRCGPCKALGPVMDSLSDSFDGKATVMKVNVDNHQEVAQQFRVTSIPTVIVFKDGEMVDEPIVGAYPEDFYADVMNKLIKE
jgi:thioredoxin 1